MLEISYTILRSEMPLNALLSFRGQEIMKMEIVPYKKIVKIYTRGHIPGTQIIHSAPTRGHIPSTQIIHRAPLNLTPNQLRLVWTSNWHFKIVMNSGIIFGHTKKLFSSDTLLSMPENDSAVHRNFKVLYNSKTIHQLTLLPNPPSN